MKNVQVSAPRGTLQIKNGRALVHGNYRQGLIQGSRQIYDEHVLQRKCPQLSANCCMKIKVWSKYKMLIKVTNTLER